MGAEKPQQFFTTFLSAVQSDNQAYLYDRLDPAVISRYGVAQCRNWVAHLQPVGSYQLVSVSKPEVHVYTTDGVSTSVPNVEVFTARSTTSGIQHFHFALIAGRFHWFTDCGTPRK